ncbi:MAG: hypothetical protein IBJ18_08875 [Phycisphaerales bacterium]|nr:hypothetical protein [Phycisphaerales bacterium]
MTAPLIHPGFDPLLTLAAQPSNPGLSSLVSSLQALPWLVHILVGLALITGLVLWLVGSSVLRPATTVVSCIVCGLFGYFFWPVLAGGSGISPYLGLFIGMVVGCLLGVAMYRLTTAATFGAILAAGFALMISAGFSLTTGSTRLTAAAGVSLIEPTDYPEPPDTGMGGGEQPIVTTPDQPNDAPLIDPDLPDPGPAPAPRAKPQPKPKQPTQPAPSDARGTKPKPDAANTGVNKPAPRTTAPTPKDPLHQDPAGGSLINTSAQVSAAAESARAFSKALREEIGARWERTPGGERLWIMVGALIGAAGGIAIGLVMPHWAAATVTSFTGAAVMLPSASWLAHGLNLPGREMLNLSAGGWIAVWLAVALVGLAIQTQGLIPMGEHAHAEPKPAKKRSSAGGKKRSSKKSGE